MSKTHRLSFALALLAQAAAPGALAQEAPADELFHVEMIVFAYPNANRFEEDFFHNQEDSYRLPIPGLMSLPDFPLQTVSDIRRPPTLGRDSVALGLGLGLGNETRTLPDYSTGTEADAVAATESPGSSVLDPQFAEAAGLPETDQEPPPLDALQFIEAYPDAPDRRDPAAASSGPRVPDGFRPLQDAELELGNVRRRLDSRREFRVLRHVGWQQTGVDTNRSIPVDLGMLGIANPIGTVEFYRQRFLHIRVDLEYFDGDGTLWSAPQGVGLGPFSYADRYEFVDELNAITLGEYGYFDHPLFGIVIQIRRAPEPEETSGQPSSGPAG